ncbi:MAG: FAD-dependent monooxygenase [Anaerolineaceae bacterium]|nr:FAD-dependent monooxygenase [Anaerolineaceae bacterium]
MSTPIQRKIIIVGGGPTGLATALHLARQLPELVDELLVLEAAEHPRPKLCGGGVTFHGEEQLRQLGLSINVPAFVVNKLVFRLGQRDFSVQVPQAMRIIERQLFDAALAQAVQARGITVHSNEKVLDIHPTPEGVGVCTSQGTYQAQVVVGADGANSVVRRKLNLKAEAGVARLLRVLTPVAPEIDGSWQQQTAVFDFSCIQRGIQGYSWDFPCYIAGRPFMNRGIFDSRIAPNQAPKRPHGNLKQTFWEGLAARNVNLDDVQLEGHPVRWFNPQAEFARPHVLLAGDAAGVDPLFAEGISYGMEYGRIVAHQIKQAFSHNDFRFDQYKRALQADQLGHLLRRRAFIAQHLFPYNQPRLYQLIWRLATIAPLALQQTFGAFFGLLPPRWETAVSPSAPVKIGHG